MTGPTWRWLLAAASLTAVAPPAHADAGLLRYESRGYQYQYCNADTPPPPPSRPVTQLPPPWAIGSYQAYDPDSGDIVQLVVDGGGRVYLRNETGVVVSQGDLRDGLVWWNGGKRSWFAREGPGVLVGDIDTGGHYNLRRNG